MTKPATQCEMPWGLVVTLALLAGAVAFWMRWLQPTPEAAPWEVVGLAALTTLAAFLAMRWLQNYFWGVVTAVLLMLHPLHGQRTEPYRAAFQVEALELVVLAVVIAGWRLAFRRDFVWRSWLCLAVLGGLATMAAAWNVPSDQASRGTALLVAWPVPLALLALMPSQRRAGDRPHRGNLACLLLVGLLFFFLVGYLSPPSINDYMLSWQKVGEASWSGLQLRAWERDQLDKWTWPTLWVMVPLVLWGLWRTVRRGWRELRKRRAPAPWVLTLDAAFGLLVPGEATAVLPLAALAVLLAVFGVADVFHGISEQLILLPPEERHDAA
jgi:hypothetical protein